MNLKPDFEIIDMEDFTRVRLEVISETGNRFILLKDTVKGASVFAKASILRKARDLKLKPLKFVDIAAPSA